AEAIGLRWAGFTCAPVAEPDFVVEVHNEPAPAGDEASLDSILSAALRGKGRDYLLDGPRFYGMIQASQGAAVLHMRAAKPAREVEYFLRIALALFALERDGLLVHGAALKRPARADASGGADLVFLFVGQSGSGKSTIAALSRAAGRATALGDDLILLRQRGEAWCAYGTPFWNFDTVARDDQLETGLVAGIYKLVQDRAVFMEPMSQAAATAELVANCPIVNDLPALLPILIDRCREIAGMITVRRLHFRKDDAFWDVI
ncbi:MAG: hypothetical protein ACM30E_03640, partial [Nitrososphaerales archaeon]